MQDGNDKKAMRRALGLALLLAAAAVAIAEVSGFQLFNDGADAEVTEQLVTQACIAQFAAGERWHRHSVVYRCATAALDTNHILTHPLAVAQ